MNLIPTDIGRPITDIKSNLRIPDIRQIVTRVVDTLEIQENDVEDNAGKWYSMRIRPYRTLDNKIDGVVIVLIDSDPRLRLKQP
jgi:two-component system, chemotaxis family, CheB/CheR fusion protein